MPSTRPHRLSRRALLAHAALTPAALAGLATGGCASEAPTSTLHHPSPPSPPEHRMSAAASRMPAVFLPHGGGPWPFVDVGFGAPAEWDRLRAYLTGLPQGLPARPRGLVVVTAHWEEPVATVSSAPAPPMLYDYYGFPPESYQLRWPAPGEPRLAARVRELFDAASIASAEDARRGFDHGTFVPMKLAYPDADVPCVQLSLRRDLDPAAHLAMGRALAPLRDEGVLIVGSGMSFHNMRAFGQRAAFERSLEFDAWLREAVALEPDARDGQLRRWEEAPSARFCHPREEHLLPLMVIAGAAGADRGRAPYSDAVLGVRVSAVHFG